MKIRINFRRLLALLLLLRTATSYGQVLPTRTDTYFPSSPLGCASHQVHPVERTLSTRTRLPVITHEGEVVLTTGVRLRGSLNYQPLTHTLRVQQANAWHTYQADQIRYFVYTDRTDDKVHHVTAFTLRLASGELQTLLLEELMPGAPIPLLQLPSPNGRHEAISQGLPLPRAANWQTKQPCFVWFDGRLLAPDAFVRTEIDALLTIVPPSVQYWAAAYPRPTNPKALLRWLSEFESEIKRARPNNETYSTPTTYSFAY